MDKSKNIIPSREFHKRTRSCGRKGRDRKGSDTKGSLLAENGKNIRHVTLQ
jgi:hypothetical protein